jgi:exodeoxyribonuclease V alpha subunit
MGNLELGYAIPCHSSQGSQYKVCIIGIDFGSYSMLSSNLIYTAITRAKKHVTIVCQPDAIECSAQNTKTTDRRTTLKELLCA